MTTHYERLFKPFTKDGSSIELTRKWLKDTTKVDDKVIDLVFVETMGLIESGEKFSLPCACGCGLNNVHTPINHFMLSRTYELMVKIDKARAEILEDTQNKILEARQRRVSGFEKEYFVMMHGKWYHRFWQWLTTYEGVR